MQLNFRPLLRKRESLIERKTSVVVFVVVFCSENMQVLDPSRLHNENVQVCYAMPCYAMLCYAMLCYQCSALLCYAMLSVLCSVMLYYALLSVLCYALL